MTTYKKMLRIFWWTRYVCNDPRLKENYDAEIITYTGDLGQGEDLSALKPGTANWASHAVVDDLQERLSTSLSFLRLKQTLFTREVPIAIPYWADHYWHKDWLKLHSNTAQMCPWVYRKGQ